MDNRTGCEIASVINGCQGCDLMTEDDKCSNGGKISSVLAVEIYNYVVTEHGGNSVDLEDALAIATDMRFTNIDQVKSELVNRDWWED